MSLPPPSPVHLIRAHASAVNVIFISTDNERIYTGDASGLVVITSTRSLRSLASWRAHTDGILGIEEWGTHIVTHGRDNKLHVWARPVQPPTALGGSAAVPGLPTPALAYSMDVNALNYCRFSLLPLNQGSSASEPRALLAVPNLVESSLADVWTLPAQERLHAAIGKAGSAAPAGDGRGGVRNATGIIMSMHLLPESSASELSEKTTKGLRLLTSYENGSVAMWQYTAERARSIEGLGWERIWTCKIHVETVMATVIALDRSLALSVSADHLVGRYDLNALHADPGTVDASTAKLRTTHPGNGAVALRGDARVCAVGGWDGKVRLFSSRALKPLGTLAHHKDAVQALAFARATASGIDAGVNDDGEDGDTDEDEMSTAEKTRRERWLVSGGKDGRVAIWELIDFSGKGT
ncbi:WD40 repeat-like protein [Auriscalpium vulgare]|uniref:WD40 repeat-like protein n=1 Tax=Auriscalpium vulgare TaxID=40419 RepID=A0ACB8RQF9_9AGAM|nr:WD40 repeat-like protein [Auriscalpium vulgare]